jgi:hypothetical protein
MFDRDYDRKGSVAKKKKKKKRERGRELQEAWRQEKLFGGKPPVINSKSEGSQGFQTVKYGYESRGTRKRE